MAELPTVNFVFMESFQSACESHSVSSCVFKGILMKTLQLLMIFGIGFLNSSWANDALPDDCGYFIDAVSTRSECSSETPGIIEFTGEANIYDNPDIELATCSVVTPQWVLDATQTCENGDCVEEPGFTKSLSLSYDNPPSSAVTSSSPTSSTQDETINQDTTLEDAEYDEIEFSSQGDGKTLTFEQSSSSTSSWGSITSSSNKSTLKVNSITNAWNVVFKDDVNIEIGTLNSSSYHSPFTLKTDNSGIEKIAIDSMVYKENSDIDLEALESIDIGSFEVGRSSSEVVLSAKKVTLDTLTVSNIGDGNANITIIADEVDITTLDMGQGAQVTILPYTSGGEVTFKANTIKASSSSELILSSGDYSTKTFDIPGSSDVSSVRAKDSDQIINFYIDGDFKPGNNPGINSAGNNGNFGSLPPYNFRLFINGDLETGGGGTTFNSVIYTEGDATLGNPTYIKGALSSLRSIKIGQGSKIYYGGDTSNDPFQTCAVAAPSSDICYSTPYTETADLVKTPMGTPTICTGFGGINCRNIIPIKNISDGNLTNVEVSLTSDGIMNGSFHDGCGVKDDKGECENVSDHTVGGQITILGYSFLYTLDDMTNDETDLRATYTESAIAVNFNNKKLYATYIKDGVKYYSTVYPCIEGGGNSTYLTGPFDAWDVTRDNMVTPPSDRNISTKIVTKPFRLSLASLNKTNDAYEPKNGAVDVAIYPKNSTNAISNHIIFNAAVAHIHETPIELNVTQASKDAIVGFKLCSRYENNVTTNTVDYLVYPMAACATQTEVYECNATTSGAPTWHICYSSDNFAVRPENFAITEVTAPIQAGNVQLFTIQANNHDDVASKEYNLSNNDYALSLTQTQYLKDDSVDNSLHGTATLSSFSFNDGISNDTAISYDDVGKINIELEDRNWAAVDADDTPASCDGRYICGDTNATFVPSYFVILNPVVHNYKDASYTYFTSDFNVSASVDVTIEARNSAGVITQNFDANSWENPIDVNLTIAGAPTPHIKNIDNTALGFNGGSKHILYTETNSSKNLLFNFNRAVNVAKNPMRVNGSQVTLHASSKYTDSSTGAITTIQEQSLVTANSNVTFIYGRTHATRQRFVGDNGNVNIFFETYCYDKDVNNISCDKTLLPNGTASKSMDDPRWFTNTLHNATTQGDAGTSSQKNGSSYVTQDTITIANPTVVHLNYDEGRGYPYKTTMINTASHWLVYDKYDSSATSNEYSVEFTNSAHSWAGKYETDTTTKQTAKDSINRRVMW